MNSHYSNFVSIILKAGLFLLLVTGLSACVVSPRHGHYHDAPPAHAPAHGYYSYWYYPDVEVYFDIHREVYFYFDAGRWVTVRVLPPHLHSHLGRHVNLRMKHDRPWREHRHHKHRYPARNKYRKQDQLIEKPGPSIEHYRDTKRNSHKKRYRHPDTGHDADVGYRDGRPAREQKHKYKNDRREHQKQYREKERSRKKEVRDKRKGKDENKKYKSQKRDEEDESGVDRKRRDR